LERLFDATLSERDALKIGPLLTKTILQRQTQHIQSPSDFVDAIQVSQKSFTFPPENGKATDLT
jgi:hypothetical protein